MLREAVDSVLAQRGVDFELIIIDDGSTDGTLDDLRRIVAHEAGRTTIRVVGHCENRGVAAARNAGAAMAAGALIAFLDSDDLWAPEKLARQVAFMHRAPTDQICQTEEIWLRDGRRINPGERHRKRGGDIFVDSLRTCLISPSAVMLRRSLFESCGGFDERMAAAEDYDLWLQILRHHEVGLLAEPLVTRRAGHPGQLSATVPAIDRFRILALLKLLAAPDFISDRRRAVAEVVAEKCKIYGRGLARRCDETAGFVLSLAAEA
jgi:glycosyltransferase involved in cell wall biosynthesis